MKRTESEKLFERAGKSIPGGVNSPVRAFRSVGMKPPFIRRAEGAWLFDEDGNKYVDFIGSWGPMILGHGHPEVLDAVRAKLADGTSYGAPTRAEIELAEMIIDRVPSAEMVRLVNSGTEATMSAVRVARAVTKRDKIVKFEGCYHGHADGFLVAAGSGALTLGQPDSPGVTKAAAADTLQARFNDIESVETLFRQSGDQIACVIVEPVNGNTGTIPPQDGFLEELRDLCHRHGALFILDEVMTGFRVARGGANELYTIDADLLTFGKIIGGGFPIGAYAGKAEYMSQVAPAGPVYQAGTLSGNPIAVTAGIETLKRLTPEFYQNLDALSQSLEKGIRDIMASTSIPLTFNRVGSMFTLFFNAGPIRNTTDVQKSDFDRFKAIFRFLLDRGFYLPPSQYEAAFLSAAHTPDMVKDFLTALSGALAALD